MSTLKANSYQHVDRASPSITINSDGSVSIASTVTYEDVTSVDSVGIITARSGINVTAGISTFGDDVVFTGAAANVTWDKSTDDLIFNDNAKAIFGTSSDGLEIYHNGNNSIINDTGTGNLIIAGSVVHIKNGDSSESFAKFTNGGSAELYHNDTLRLTTTNTGVDITDNLSVAGILTVSDYIQHLGDTNTAIRFPAADTITAETGGTERVRITSAGLVGIATAEPYSILTAYGENKSGSGSATGQITAKDNAAYNASPTGGLVFQGHYHSNQANAVFGGITGFKENATDGNYAGALAFHTRPDGAVSEERLRIQSNGRVGVGTASARAFLDLCGAAENATLLLDSNDENSNLCLMDNAGSVRMLNYGGALALRVGGTGAFSGDTEKVRIDSAGRVLINTTSNTNAHTQCDDLVVGNTSHGHDTGVTIVSNPSYSGWLAFSDGTSASDQRKGAIVYVQSKDTMYFRNSGNTTRLSINQDGNAEFTGIVTATSFVPTEGQTGGFKNLIINGDAQVAQYGTTISEEGYACDRFNYLRSGINEELTLSQHGLTSPDDVGPWAEGLRNSIHLQNGNQTGGAGASDYTIIRYKVEARDLATSGWNYTSSSSYITLSYWVKSSVAQNFYQYLRTHDGTQKGFTWETGALSANTWKKIIVRIPGDSGLSVYNDNGIGMLITFSPYWGGTWTDNSVALNSWHTWGSGNTRTPDYTTTWWTTDNATFEITGVQLEVGSEPTPFEHITYAEQLRRCQRYYQEIQGSSGTTLSYLRPIGHDGNTVEIVPDFVVPMRANPTVTVTGTIQCRACAENTTDTTITLSGSSFETPTTNITTGHMWWDASSGTPFTAGYSGRIKSGASGSSINFSAEI